VYTPCKEQTTCASMVLMRRRVSHPDLAFMEELTRYALSLKPSLIGVTADEVGTHW